MDKYLTEMEGKQQNFKGTKFKVSDKYSDQQQVLSNAVTALESLSQSKFNVDPKHVKDLVKMSKDLKKLKESLWADYKEFLAWPDRKPS